MSSSRDSGFNPRQSESVDVVRAILEGVLEVLESWSDKDLAAFVNGERQLVLRAKPARSASRAHAERRPAPEAAVVREELSGLSTRDEGLEYLDQLKLNRESLQRLAIALDVPATRSDTIDRVRNRIVEAFIGYRLRSSAVRGETVGTQSEGDESKQPDAPA